MQKAGLYIIKAKYLTFYMNFWYLVELNSATYLP